MRTRILVAALMIATALGALGWGLLRIEDGASVLARLERRLAEMDGRVTRIEGRLEALQGNRSSPRAAPPPPPELPVTEDAPREPAANAGARGGPSAAALERIEKELTRLRARLDAGAGVDD